MASFDYFIALDGDGLNGFGGFASVTRRRCDLDRDAWDIEVRFYDGVAHSPRSAVQVRARFA